MAEDGWDLTGIPKPWWPYVRDFLAARDLYRLSTLVSDRKLGKSIAQTAEGVLVESARHLAEGKSPARG